ncbi:MAG: anaerobic sulfatase maturase [Lachnospiraceae bacterium]|nr:anaerobic sulfatase maturase [Lachnospiraceae bacterium]
MSGKTPVVVMAKPVGSRCNMRCGYCYYLQKERYSSHAVQTVMETKLLEKLIRDTIACSPGPTVSFVWHGGEPLLAGQAFFRKALQLQRRFLPPGWTAWNNLQTNGLLLSDEWIAYLSRNHFDIGISIDGDEAVHDANRKDLGGKGTYSLVKAAVERCIRAGIRPDLLCTVNAESVKDPLRVYRALRDLGTGWIQFIPIVVKQEDGPVRAKNAPDVGLSKESVTPEQYGRFLITIFDEWITHDIGTMEVQFFAEIAQVLAGHQASLCWMQKTCGRVLIAEEDGAVYSCDHFVDDQHRLGFLQDAPLDVFLGLEAQQAFGLSKESELTKECRACPYLRFCNGACPKDRFGLSEDGEPGQYVLCGGLKAFFEHALQPMNTVMGWLRDGMDAEKAMHRVRRLL